MRRARDTAGPFFARRSGNHACRAGKLSGTNRNFETCPGDDMSRDSAPGARFARALAALALGIFTAVPATGQVGYRVDPQGKDELWDVTSKMEIPGMPMAMPAQTHRVCIEKGDASMVPKQEGCTVTDVKRAGNTVSYRMTCKNGRNDYTATGESRRRRTATRARCAWPGRWKASRWKWRRPTRALARATARRPSSRTSPR